LLVVWLRVSLVVYLFNALIFVEHSMTEPASYFSYWGKYKLNENTLDYHLLPYHCLDVAAVGDLLLSGENRLVAELAEFLQLSPEQLRGIFTFFLAIHDIGKFASSFQGLCQHNDPNLIQRERCRTYDSGRFRHDRMGAYFWDRIQDAFIDSLDPEKAFTRREKSQIRFSLEKLVNCVLGHHGQPVTLKETREIRKYTEPHNLQAAEKFFHELYALLSPDFPVDRLLDTHWPDRLAQVSWHLAGIAVLADWIGSNRDYFPYQSERVLLDIYWNQARQQAIYALKSTDLYQSPTPTPFQSVTHHFKFEPTPLQAWTEQVAVGTSPQLFILEDITGSGKTEAALTLTHRLMAAGAADGFYFGLPTMATSNAMFDRVANYYLQMFACEEDYRPSIVLAHGAREMNDRFRRFKAYGAADDTPYDKHDQTITAQCNQWIGDSSKKALLAPVGIGTIDQALLAVLPRRHQSLRLLGLHRKVLIFDEVHAADEYMFELLEHLLKLHLHQGGSAILLTATLSKKQRQRLSNIWLEAAELPAASLQKTAFPLATRVDISAEYPVTEQQLASRPEVSREVRVSFLHSEQACMEAILEAVNKGQCVVWIRNSVNSAIDAYQQVCSALEAPDNCLLFHSRFTLADRKRIETGVLEIFGKNSCGDDRRGKVLIATQVFQESLDADADVMISDLCPIDDLIQRAGRLHRHTRNKSGERIQDITDAREEPVLYVHAPEWDENPGSDWLSREFRDTESVYRSPGRLWLGMRILRSLGAIRMPGEARELIEAVYGEHANKDIPPALTDQELALFGENRAKAASANSQLIDFRYGYSTDSSRFWSEDNSDISTRYSDMETVSVLLLKTNSAGDYVPQAEDSEFAVALSTMKVAKNKYADKLVTLSDHEIEKVQKAYPQARFLQLWVPERDSEFMYCPKIGLHQKTQQEVE
jgi:CRISPR-associated endonuclease/helicase Cas3